MLTQILMVAMLLVLLKVCALMMQMHAQMVKMFDQLVSARVVLNQLEDYMHLQCNTWGMLSSENTYGAKGSQFYRRPARG